MTDTLSQRLAELLALDAERTPALPTSEVQQLVRGLMGQPGRESGLVDRAEGEAGSVRALEEALAEHQRRARQVEALAGLGVWELDLVTNRLTWSDEVFRMFGLAPSEFGATYEAFLAHVHPEDRGAVHEAYAGSIREGRDSYEVEHRIVNSRSGGVLFVREKCEHVRGAGGAIVRSVGMVLDVTAQREARAVLERARALLEESVAVKSARLARTTRELERSEARYRSLVEGLEDVVFELDREGRVVFASQALERVFGYAIEAVRGQRFDAFVHPDDLEALETSLRLVTEGNTRADVFRLRRADGEHTWASSLARLAFAGVGDEALDQGRIVGTLKDISQQRAAEEQLRRAQRLQSVGQLAGGIAHDFNNLLFVILSCTDFAIRKVDSSAPMLPDLLEVQSAAERAAVLTQQLLAFGCRQPRQPQRLQLNAVVSGVEHMVRSMLSERVALTFELAPELGCVMADRGQLEQILLNLVINARDAMDGVGELRIVTREVRVGDEGEAWPLVSETGRIAVFAVADTGCGMDAATRGRVFEPFFTTKEPGRGTGLGLASVYGIVQQSGGAIRVESEPGEGTVFMVGLPVVDGVEGKAVVGEAPRLRGSETVLVVEDERVVREVTRRILEAAGYTVLVASGAQEAWALVESSPGRIDLLLSDVVMPQVDGPGLARRLRQRLPGLKVLYMSGYAEDVLVRQGTATGRAQIVSKPFKVATLTDAVRAALDGGVGCRAGQGAL